MAQDLDLRIYNLFVLHCDSMHMTTLFSVPDCDAVRRLISDNNWQLSPAEP